MPRSAFFSREAIIEKGLEVVRESGMDALSARSLSKKLECSLSPIFTVFENMDEIKSAVYQAAKDIFDEYVKDVTEYAPAFKELGMRIVRFAKDEQNLYSLLFLRKGPAQDQFPDKAKECLAGLEKAYGITPEQSAMLFRQLWPFACGLAVMSAQNPDAYTDDDISQMISCQFTSLMVFIKSGKEVMNITPRKLNPGESLERKF